MAIPFNVEEVTEYAQLQQLLTDLWHVAQQIQVLHHLRGNNAIPEARATASTSSSSNRRVARNQSGQFQQHLERRLPEPVVNLALSLEPVNSSNGATNMRRNSDAARRCRQSHRRSRSVPSTASSSSSSAPTVTLCCKNAKPVKVSVSVEFANNKWVQGESSQASTNIQSCGSESLLSKLVPTPFNGPLWTAVICMVGWHLLRTR